MSSLDWLLGEVSARVGEAFERWMRDGTFEFEYVWFRRGGLVIAVDEPAGYELAFKERVPTDRERWALVMWVYDRMRCVPCLPEEA